MAAAASSFSHVIRSWFTPRRHCPVRRRPLPARPRLEALEDRIVPTAPVVAANNALVAVKESVWALNTGTFSDADGNMSVTLSASVGTVLQDDAAGTWSWSYRTSDGPDQSQTVTISASDGANVTTTTFQLTVANFAPLVQIGGVATSANLVRLYNLNGTLTDALGGPTLTADGGTLAGGRYAFGANQGLRLDHGLADTRNYSIELVMQYADLAPFYKKLIDFNQRASDFGLYVSNNLLNLYPGGVGTDTIAANTDFHLVLTRDGASGATRLYLNGVLQNIYVGFVSDVAIPPDNVLVFFEDDTETGYGEAQAGSVDYIAVYDGALSAADVTALALASGSTSPSSVTVNEGQTAGMSGTFHDPGTDAVTVTASIGTISQSSGSHGTWSWSFLADDGPGQSQTVIITATDSDGASSTTSFSLTVNNLTPTASLTNNGPASEGSTAVVSFANQLDPSAADTATFHYAYDFDNDGVFEVGNGTYAGSATAASATVPAGFLADGPGTRTVHGRILDKDGAFSDYTTTIDIVNAPPTVAADQATVTVGEGQTASNTGTYGDPGVDTVTLTASFGTFSANGGVWTWSFATNDGPDQSQTFTITATDSDGAVTTTTFNLVVNNVAPSVAANQASVTVNEGQTAANTGTFGDVGLDSVTLNASVGDVVDNGGGIWSWSLATNDGPAQTQTVTITALDSDGLVSTTTFSLVVNNVNPTITSFTSSATSTNPGQPGTPITVQGAFTDPGTADTHHAVIAWGDGTQTTLAENDPGMNQTANTLAASHAYAAAGSYTVTVTLYDDDGGSAVRTTTAVIQSSTFLPGTVTLLDGVLYVIGPAGDDHVTVNKQNNTQLKVHASFLTDGSFVTFGLSGIRLIVVDLGAGNDFFSIADNITLPVIVLGGAGSDQLSAGGGSAALIGGAGIDNLSGGSGRDLLIGGPGEDRLHGRDGADLFIHGSTHRDNDVNTLIAALRAWNAAADRAARIAAVNAIFADGGDNVAGQIAAKHARAKAGHRRSR